MLTPVSHQERRWHGPIRTTCTGAGSRPTDSSAGRSRRWLAPMAKRRSTPRKRPRCGRASGWGRPKSTAATTDRVPSASLPTATAAETLGVLAEVVAPPVAKGPILRRPLAMRLFSRLDLDGRAIRRLQRLRRSYPSGPLMLTMPGPPRALVLQPQDVRRILDGAPDPFAPDTREKRAALAHFEPQGVLVSRSSVRAERRSYNEAVLEPDRPVHALGEGFVRVAYEKATGLL